MNCIPIKEICVIISVLFFISCGNGNENESVDSAERANQVSETPSIASRDINGVKNAQDMMFAAYAGIAYGNTDDIADNNIFYNVMFYNLNNMVAYLGFRAIPPEELSFSSIYQMAQMMLSTEITRPYNEVGVNEEILLKGNIVYFPPKIVFSVKSTIDFDEEQPFSYNNWSWETDNNENTDSEVQLNAAGELSSFQDKSTVSLIPSINTFVITTSPSLIARLNKYTVRYNNWQISYNSNTAPSSNDVPNMYILPLSGNYLSPSENPEFPDNREYSISGSFTINGLEYGYKKGFTYKQTSEIIGKDKNSKPIIESTIIIEGALKIPGDTGYVIVSSSEIYPIIRDADGVWKSGMLFINGQKDFAEIAFNDGNATIFCGSEEKTIKSWQTALQPKL